MGLIDDLMRSQTRLDGPPRAGATVHVAFLTVKFSESPAQSYGYDDMDTAADTTDDHVSVKQLGTTKVHVAVHGGPTGSDVLFVCDDEAVAKIGGLGPSTFGKDKNGQVSEFDITINGQDTGKGATLLRALAPQTKAELARININTYKEKQVTATVMKAYDSRSTGTTLKFPKLDISSIPPLVNPKYKDAVAVLALTDQSSTGDAFDIPFDNDRNGKLTWDIAAAGGAEWNAIKSQFTVSGQRVVIVRDMVSVYLLAAAAPKGATTLTINSSSSFLTSGQTYPLGTGTTRESINVTAVSNATVTIAAGLSNAHSIGETIEFPAAGWGGDPVVIVEGSSSDSILKWTFGHELGHAVLILADVGATESIMNFSQGWTDHRLRFKPLPKKYYAGTENQWETIAR